MNKRNSETKSNPSRFLFLMAVMNIGLLLGTKSFADPLPGGSCENAGSERSCGIVNAPQQLLQCNPLGVTCPQGEVVNQISVAVTSTCKWQNNTCVEVAGKRPDCRCKKKGKGPFVGDDEP